MVLNGREITYTMNLGSSLQCHYKLTTHLQEAAEAKREKELKSLKFTQGKRAYSTGQYAASLVLFQEALDKEGELSALGGEIQLWLALAYQVTYQITKLESWMFLQGKGCLQSKSVYIL